MASQQDVINDIMKRQGFSRYMEEDIPKITKEYDGLWDICDPEEDPYKSKYEARKLLEAAVKEVEQRLSEISECEEAEQGREMLARLFLYLGKNLYYCEEVPNAELYFLRSLERYLRSPLRLQPGCFIHTQDLFNQLGMLWCTRHNHAEGMNFLRRAQIMFLNRPKAVRDACEEQAENNYTLTMFYLAQCYGGLKKPGLSARFCAETMSRQLSHNTGDRPKEVQERDPFDCKDWVRNCCALSDFFANECMFWTAEYLLHSASVMSAKSKEICGFEPEGIDELQNEVFRDMGTFYSTRLKFAKTCAENPALCEEIWRGERKPAEMPDQSEASAGSRLTFRCAADGGKDKAPEGGTGPIKWDDIFPEVVHLEDEEAEDNKLAEETMAVGEFAPPSRKALTASGASAAKAASLELGPDDRVRLPVHFGPLHEMVERRMQKANVMFLKARGPPALVEDLEKVDETDEGKSSATPTETANQNKGRKVPSCVGTTIEAAREIFRLADRYCICGIAYFILDGFVTEHIRIMQQISELYRILMFWEKDPRRVRSMLSRRRQMLAPILQELNPRAYIAFYRQISFECGEVCQEHYELKAEGKMPGSGPGCPLDDDTDVPSGCNDADQAKIHKCNILARTAIDFYQKFITTYHPDKKPPGKVEDDDTRVYLTAHMNLARLCTKMKGIETADQIAWHKDALGQYEFIIDYANRNPDVCTKPSIGMATEIRLCEEMAGMLPSKLDRIASRARRQ